MSGRDASLDSFPCAPQLRRPGGDRSRKRPSCSSRRERPLFIVGGGVVISGAEQELARLRRAARRAGRDHHQRPGQHRRRTIRSRWAWSAPTAARCRRARPWCRRPTWSCSWAAAPARSPPSAGATRRRASRGDPARRRCGGDRRRITGRRWRLVGRREAHALPPCAIRTGRRRSRRATGARRRWRRQSDEKVLRVSRARRIETTSDPARSAWWPTLNACCRAMRSWSPIRARPARISPPITRSLEPGRHFISNRAHGALGYSHGRGAWARISAGRRENRRGHGRRQLRLHRGRAGDHLPAAEFRC